MHDDRVLRIIANTLWIVAAFALSAFVLCLASIAVVLTVRWLAGS